MYRNRITDSHKEFKMTRIFPTELNQFIQDELQTGGYADEDAVLTAALEVFREVRQRHAELLGRVQESLCFRRAQCADRYCLRHKSA